jgi:RHS repeat-associated protein
VLKEYIRGLDMGGGIGSIIYQKKSSDYYYYHYNHKGDVVALTDGNGDLAPFYEYDAWGNRMTEAEVSGVDNPYRYSTKEWDEESGLSYFGARYYSPEIGRWTQRDRLGPVGGLNLYWYLNSQPGNAIDPWGLEPLGPFNFGTGPLVDIGVYAYRSGPPWMIEILFLSTNMCHYWLEIEPRKERVDTGGLRTVKKFEYSGDYKPSAKWPVYWEQSKFRKNAFTGKTCDYTCLSEIYDCIENMGKKAHKYSSCVNFVDDTELACCLLILALPMG